MRPPRIPDAPAGFDVEETRAAVLVVSRAAAPDLRAAGYGVESDGALARSDLAGRRPLLELATRGGPLLVRRFSHGGLLRFLTGERYADPARPFRELCVSSELARRGVLTPEVVAARAQAAAVWGWRLDLVTRRVEGAADVEAVLVRARRERASPRSSDSVRTIARIAGAAGALVRRLHDAGCLHADLTPKNMLVGKPRPGSDAPELWILDLDRARIETRLSDAQRRENLRRLFRFVARREERDGRALSRSDYARFLRGYDPEGTRWKADWRAILAAHERSLFWHAIGWRLEGAVGSRRATSPGT